MSRKELVEEIHKPVRKHFQRRRVIVRGFDDLWQGDLVDMSAYSRENKGFKFLLTVIDVFSKYAWTVPVKDKTAISIKKAMQSIFDQGRVCKNFQTDDGTEFFNKEFSPLAAKYKINHYSVYSSLKASIIERFNRTIKGMMWKRFSLNGNYRWINIIDDLCTDYNNRIHRTINMKPSMVTKTDEKRLLNTVYAINEPLIKNKTKFHLGDKVRISKYKHIFEKSYTPNWTYEIFTIRAVKHTNPETYLLRDNLGRPIKGGFYKFELLKAKQSDVYLIEKILQRKGQNILVKWMGHDDSFNSWVDKNSVL